MRYLSNAFSLGMLADFPLAVEVSEAPSIDAATEFARDAVSVVGHQDTANLFSTILGLPIEFNRVSTRLEKGDEVLIGQYVGPRLPEGATSLPEGATIKWLFLTIR